MRDAGILKLIDHQVTHRRIHAIGHIHRGLIGHGETPAQTPRQSIGERAKGQPPRLIGQTVRRAIERKDGTIKTFCMIRGLRQITRQQIIPQRSGGRLTFLPQSQLFPAVQVGAKLGEPPQFVQFVLGGRDTRLPFPNAIQFRMIKVQSLEIRLRVGVRHVGDRDITQDLYQGLPVGTLLRQIPKTRKVTPAIRMFPRDLPEGTQKAA